MQYNEIKQNELEIRSYDVNRRYGTDWVTEYVYITDKNLSLDEFETVLKDEEVCGAIRYFKKVMNFTNGQKLYKHICKAVMY